jgi:hypothetical protein
MLQDIKHLDDWYSIPYQQLFDHGAKDLLTLYNNSLQRGKNSYSTISTIFFRHQRSPLL